MISVIFLRLAWIPTTQFLRNDSLPSASRRTDCGKRTQSTGAK